MKVVLFCGGLGMRIRNYSENTPKPMVNIGSRPILWYLMKYYAHYGHKDFILCLGYKGDMIKNYFLNYDECLSNDFTMSNGGKKVELHNSDIHDWRITFVDTGVNSNIGERLRAVENYVREDEIFLANYTDGLTDLCLPKLINYFSSSKKTAIFLSVRPNQSFHVVTMDGNGNGNGKVKDIKVFSNSGLWINGGFFAFRKEIFRYINEGEELVDEPFRRLIEKEELITYQYEGFWVSMDTFKDKQRLDDQYFKGGSAWEVWKSSSRGEREGTYA